MFRFICLFHLTAILLFKAVLSYLRSTTIHSSINPSIHQSIIFTCLFCAGSWGSLWKRWATPWTDHKSFTMTHTDKQDRQPFILLSSLVNLTFWFLVSGLEKNFLHLNINKTRILLFVQPISLNSYNRAIRPLHSYCHQFAFLNLRNRLARLFWAFFLK